MITFIFIILITSKKIIFMLTQTSLLFSSVIFNIFAIFIRKQKNTQPCIETDLKNKTKIDKIIIIRKT